MNIDQSDLFHLCQVIDKIRTQIKKRRVEKRLTQSDVALDLGITPGAYSKIESGPTEISVTKLVEIADILEVNITYFFGDDTAIKKEAESISTGNFASKNDMDKLVTAINKMKQEIAGLKSTLEETTSKKKG